MPDPHYPIRIVSLFVPESSIFRPVWAVVLLLSGSAGTALSQLAAPASLPATAVPERFFQVQDEAGFLWQALDNGALLSGDTQYLQSGLNLIVNGQPFSPTSATAQEPGSGKERISVKLEEKRSDLVLTRDLWFDTQRSGVRVWDAFANTGSSELSLEVVLRTTYPFAWQSLHGSGGAVLGTEPSLAARPGDFSLGVHFSPSEGRHDTYFLYGSERGGQKPVLRASANSRELTFTYALRIPAGESRSLVHWILQRNLPEVSQDLAALAPFVQRGQWIDAGLDAKSPTRVVNLVPEAFPSSTSSSPRLRALVALNDLTDRLGLSRRSEDLLWLGPSNAISGKLERSGSITVESAWRGSTETPIAAIAAIRGGAGQGIPTAIYLRDGRVLTGQVTQGELRWTTKESPNAELLDLSAIHVVLCATEPEDGGAPPGTSHFLQLANGSVLALSISPQDSLTWISPVGKVTSPWSSLVELAREVGSVPKWRLLLQEGAYISGMLPTGTLALRTADGRDVEVPASLIDRIWRPETPLRLNYPKGDWMSFSEVPEGIGPETGLLLAGNELLAGTLVPATLTLRDGSTTVKVASDRLLGMERSDDPANPDHFVLQLQGGERLSGQILDRYLWLDSPQGKLELPFDQVLAYRQAPKS